MHQLIIAEASVGEKTGRCRLRLIGNAAGPLLPSLATSLKSTFWCVHANALSAVPSSVLGGHSISWLEQSLAVCTHSKSPDRKSFLKCSLKICYELPGKWLFDPTPSRIRKNMRALQGGDHPSIIRHDRVYANFVATTDLSAR